MFSKTSITLAKLDEFSFTQLKGAFTHLYNQSPPKSAARGFLKANIAYRLQEVEQDCLNSKTSHKLLKIARELEKDPAYSPAPSQDIKPGTRLVRRWQNNTHEVTVLDAGFEYQGQRYRSLSKIAMEITGTKWSGPVFFGLKDRSRVKGAAHAK